MLVLLAAQAAGYRGRDHILLAAVVESIHTDTLLHDAVVDESERPRGSKTRTAQRATDHRGLDEQSRD